MKSEIMNTRETSDNNVDGEMKFLVNLRCRNNTKNRWFGHINLCSIILVLIYVITADGRRTPRINSRILNLDEYSTYNRHPISYQVKQYNKEAYRLKPSLLETVRHKINRKKNVSSIGKNDAFIPPATTLETPHDSTQKPSSPSSTKPTSLVYHHQQTSLSVPAEILALSDASSSEDSVVYDFDKTSSYYPFYRQISDALKDKTVLKDVLDQVQQKRLHSIYDVAQHLVPGEFFLAVSLVSISIDNKYNC